MALNLHRIRSIEFVRHWKWEKVAGQPVAGIQVVHIPRRGCQLERDAKLEVRYAEITLKPPKGTGYPPVEVWMVYAREIDCSKAVANPLEWMLLSTVEAGNF